MGLTCMFHSSALYTITDNDEDEKYQFTKQQ